MTAYQRLERNVREFAKPYPEGLAERLAWWGEALGIDRVRLLRMIGLSSARGGRAEGRRSESDRREAGVGGQCPGGGRITGPTLISLYKHDSREPR